jgi:hypothetical protein
MKLLLIVFVLVNFSSVWAWNGKDAWTHSPMKSKVELLNSYQTFFSELEKNESFDEFQHKSSKFIQLLFSEAWASSLNMDCLYAGWPSKRIQNKCSSPLKHNPDYKKGSCQEGQIQCQPLLFGKNNCVPISSAEQRSLATSNCQKNFQNKKKSPEGLIREIRADGKEKELFELMDFGDKICRESRQKETPMCGRLLASITKMRHFKPDPLISATSGESSKMRGPAVTSIGRSNTENHSDHELIETVKSVGKISQGINQRPDCEVEPNGTPFDREVPREIIFDYVTSKTGSDPSWEDNFIKDKTEEDLRYKGFTITNRGPNTIAGEPIDPREKVVREWSFVSEDNSKRETYLWITDDSGSGYLSGLMESVILIIPRKMKPSVSAVNDEIHVTLTTGEKVIYDKTSKMIKAGVFVEGKVDVNPNRFERKFAPVKYSGAGISIRVDKRGEDPRLISGNAVITQNGKTCQVPAKELWDTKADFKYQDDKRLLDFLNTKCAKKFSL